MGLYGTSDNYGVYGVGNNYGVYGSSRSANSHAVEGHCITSSGYDFYASGSDESTYYRENELSFDFSAKLSHKITAKINGYIGTNDYNQIDRDDDLLGAGLELDYAIQEWLSLAAGYQYKDRDSNIDAEDYTNDQYFVSLKARL